MKLGTILRISAQKLRSYKGKTLFIIVPVAILVAVGITLSSEASNIQNAAARSIFGTIEEQARLILLQKNDSNSFKSGGGGGGQTFSIGGPSQSDYTETDLAKVQKLAGVETASLVRTVPTGPIVATGLFKDVSFKINGLAGLDSSVAKQYTDQSFDYTNGGVIPIVISANQFQQEYEDWQGKTEITQELKAPTPGAGRQTFKDGSPNKTRQITYDKNALIGKTFTGSVGGLDTLPTFKVEPNDAGITFKKYTQAELDKAAADRKSAISPYWNYDALAKPNTYTFKVVGVIEGDNDRTSYIPTAAANALVKGLIQKQLSSRTATELPTSTLNKTFNGMTYDGLELKQGFSMGGKSIRVSAGPSSGGAVGFKSASADSGSDTGSYQIPGLVVKTTRSSIDASNPFDTGTVEGVETATDVYEKASATSGTILVKTKSVYDRPATVAALNKNGYSYNDTVQLDVLANLQSRMKLFVTIFNVVFIVLCALVVGFSLSRFIAESRREIGVFRALGARRAQIRQLFVSQTLIASVVAGVSGIALGVAVTLGISGVMHSWFAKLIDTTVRQTYPTVKEVAPGAFQNVDWAKVGIYGALLLGVTLLVAVLVSTAAARIKPTESFRQE